MHTAIDPELHDLTEQLIAALQKLAPGHPSVFGLVVGLAPYAAFLAAAAAAVIAWKNLKQQQRALADTTINAGRAQWWQRTQWALDAAASNNPAMNGYGAAMLDLLATSPMAQDEDTTLLDAVWKGTPSGMRTQAISDLLAEVHRRRKTVVGMQGPTAGPEPEDDDQLFAGLRREILAARLKVTLDERLKRETPPAVKSLAAMDLPQPPTPYPEGETR